MFKKMIPLVTCLLFINAVLSMGARHTINANPQRPDPWDKALLSSEKQWHDAFARHDTDTFISFLSDDYVAINDDGSFTNRAQVIAILKTSDVNPSIFKADDQMVRGYGDTAVITGRGYAKGKLRGRESEGSFRYTEVWVQRGGRWQVVLWQGTKITPDPGNYH